MQFRGLFNEVDMWPLLQRRVGGERRPVRDDAGLPCLTSTVESGREKSSEQVDGVRSRDNGDDEVEAGGLVRRWVRVSQLT